MLGRKRFISSLSVVSLAVIGLVGGLFSSQMPAPRAEASGLAQLSEVAQQAFTDLTTCLTSGREKAIDVFYLIDESDSMLYTDPDVVRRDILANSVVQLGNFAEQGVTVNVASALFSTGVNPLFSWQAISSPDEAVRVAGNLADAITASAVKQGFVKWTDYEAGLRHAEREFSAIDPNGTNCQALIWLTDGGIRPGADRADTIPSLSRLCHSDITTENLTRQESSRLGLMSTLRERGVFVFAVFYNNEEGMRDEWRSQGFSDQQIEDRIEDGRYTASFLKPLVEGSGTVYQGATIPGFPEGGYLECADLRSDGKAVAGQANGAFLDAEDPITLAFQFLRLESQLSGGRGIDIIDGRFTLPAGAVGFRIITTSSDWALTGPEGSGLVATSASPSNVNVQLSGGATSLYVRTDDRDEYVGAWQFDSGGLPAELYLISGLTLELDRDRSSAVLGDFDNTLTGRVVRTLEYRNLPVDLSRFDGVGLGLELLDGEDFQALSVDASLTDAGDIALAKFNPGNTSGDLQLWMTLSLGGQFSDIISQFDVTVVDKAVLATPTADILVLTPLEGPDGVARGELTIVGPSASGSMMSTFCISTDATRLSDNQIGVEYRERGSSWRWAFGGTTATNAGLCLQLQPGQDAVIPISVENPTQADSSVTSVWTVRSVSEGGAAVFEAPLTIGFESVAQSNPLVEAIVTAILVALGLLAPLGLMALVTWWFTRFNSLREATRAVIPVTVTNDRTRALVDRRPSSAGPNVVIQPDDFTYLDNAERPRQYATGYGEQKSRVPRWPLGTSWFEWQAPAGSRVFSSYVAATKSDKSFDSGHAVEVSPNLSENWALVIRDSELADASKDQFEADLIVYSPLGNVADYQKRVDSIGATAGLFDRVKAVATTIAADASNESTEPPDNLVGAPNSGPTNPGPVDPPKPPPLSGRLAPPAPPQ